MSVVNNSLSNMSTASFTSPNFLTGYTTTATAAGTTTLTVSSNELQYFTGSTTQTVVLPVTSTLVLGQSFTINNNSTGVVTVQSSGANTIQAMAASTGAVFTCILTSGTTAASWNLLYYNSTNTALNIAGGVANDLVYQTAASTTGFIAPVSNSVLTTNGSGVPSWSSTAPVATIPIDATTITSTGSVIQASGTFNGGLSTAPVSSDTATNGFYTSATAGTALKNTLGYDIMVNICVDVTSSTTATLVLGVGSTSTPTTDTVVPSFTFAALTPLNFTAIVPNNYYLLINSTGTIVISSITLQSCPL